MKADRSAKSKSSSSQTTKSDVHAPEPAGGPTKKAPKPKGKRRPPVSAVGAPRHPDMPAFCAGLRRLRGDMGMTLDQLAERSGLTPNYIGTIENGYRDPSLSTLTALARGLGVPLGELFGQTRSLSHPATDMGRRFADAPDDLQAAILKLLHALAMRHRAGAPRAESC